jgi:glutamyl-tRNA reductase
MALVCLGLSHHTAPLEVRERHAFPVSRMAETLVALRDYEAVREAALLATCGRLEIYAELEDYETGIKQLKAFLRNFRHGAIEYDLSAYLYALPGMQAAEHLFRVATGLDSMLIGEAEILGQVKDAYSQAQKARSLGKTLHALFREALKAGKTARAQTAIGNQSVSISSAAVAYAKQHLGDLSELSVLIVGAGKMGTLAAKRMRQAGAGTILVANRTFHKANEVADTLGGGHAVELPGLTQALTAADIVVTSAGASHFVLTPANVTEAMLSRPRRPLFVIDIAVPRDADPEIALIPNVRVADIDALKGLVEENIERRREAIPDVEEIISEHVDRFEQWYRSRFAVPIVASLVHKAEAIREYEIERLFARCPELTERERMMITGASLTIISKLLHGAVTRIRERATGDRSEEFALARMVNELFDLQEPTHERPQPMERPPIPV